MNRHSRINVLAGMAVVVAMTAAAIAQVHQLNTGGTMDANPGVGTGGANQGVRGYIPINGNDVMTGNVPGLQYFHGSPALGGGTGITSQYQFQGTLGTSTLNSFERQSAGNGIGGGSALNQVYYLPSATVSSSQGGIYSAPIGSGFDSNLVPRTSLSPVATASQIQALDPGAAASNGAAFNRTMAASAATPDIGTPGAVLTSPIFALREMELTPVTPDQNFTGNTPSATPLPGTTDNKNNLNVTPSDQDAGTSGQQDLRVGAQADNSLSPTDKGPKDLRISSSYQTLLDQLKKAETDGKATDSTGTTGAGGTARGARGTNVLADNTVDPLTGRSRQTILKKPGAQSTTQPNSDGPGADLIATDEQKKEAMPAKSLEDLPLSTLQAGNRVKPMTTLVRIPVDGKATPVDVLMTQAEKLLKDGKYLEAAERYQTALAREPGNALALIGRANAELGAGMYQSAAYDLKYVFTRNPQMISVHYEMDQFMPKTRQDYLVNDLQTLEGGRETGNTASFLLSYLYYETGRMEQLRAQLARWNAQPTHDAWQTVLNKAWSSKAPEGAH